MTQRLYYTDSYTTQFDAHILEHTTVDDKPAIVLDRTYFYPTGGGQPYDTGTINDARVIDVISREDAVLHVLDRPLQGENARCQVDWARRFDFMQHHTGQHILTQAFVQEANTQTVSFHLSGDSVTIDLDQSVTADQVAATERLANQIVWENRSVTAEVIDPANAEKRGVRMRKMPEQIHTDGLRIIDIGGFDITACGGTHVARTGEIGVIKVIKLEKRGDKTRVEFRCGERALRDYQLKNTLANTLAADLTCGIEDVPNAVTRLKDELQTIGRALKAATNQLIQYEAAQLINETPLVNGVRRIKRAFDGRDLNDVRILASALIETPSTIVLLGTAGEKAQIYLARSADLSHNMNVYLKPALDLIGARGGGQPGFVQGGGVKASLDQLRAALDAAESALKNA